MPIDLKTILEHDMSDDCPICRVQETVDLSLIPAVSAWEQAQELPRFSLALHGAAGLLGILLEEGVPRDALEQALSGLLNDLEQQIEENRALGGPTQGTA